MKTDPGDVALMIRCPICGAAPYQLCMYFGKKPKETPHKVRVREAKKR